MTLTRILRAFVHDEDGAVTVEAVILFTGFVGIASAVSNQIVVPLVENAQAQAALNEESLRLIEQAMATCSGTAL
ncbi:MAG: hypothetical protein H6833_13880 [Planctomycetes bacterium]|nr:hypothetical protein [Planctomycetota bacterium]